MGWLDHTTPWRMFVAGARRGFERERPMPIEIVRLAEEKLALGERSPVSRDEAVETAYYRGWARAVLEGRKH